MRSQWIRSGGYTLIEIMVALTVFALLAAMTSGVMYHVFDIRSRVAVQAEQLDQLQLLMTLLNHDTVQFVPRSIRTNDSHVFPAFIGATPYMEFTRGGLVNPHAVAQRSTLKRIAYVCKKNQLLRRSWPALDLPQRNSYEERLLLDGLSECFFSYVTSSREFLPEWHGGYTAVGSSHRDAIPTAIQLTINPFGWGDMKLLFVLPEGLYAG